MLSGRDELEACARLLRHVRASCTARPPVTPAILAAAAQARAARRAAATGGSVAAPPFLGMRPVSYFVAASLDGYIARIDGAVDWLFTDQDYGYNDFIATVDTVLLGRKTFDQLLSWGDPYPYASQRSIIFSTTLPDQALEAITQDDQGGPTAGRGKSGIGIEIERGAPVARVRALKKKPGNGKIWLVGGSQLAAPLIAEGLVDEMVLSLHPVLLGDGIPLFRPGMGGSSWQLVGSKAFSTGLVQLTYQLAKKIE